MSRHRITGFLLILIGMTGTTMAQKGIKISWDKAAPLPPAMEEKVQPGVAGGLIGFSHNHLILAGGANFSDTLPWNGGTKKYHDEIFVYTPSLYNNGRWAQATDRLPAPVAYSASVPYNNRVICAGGENSAGPVSQVLSLECVLGEVVVNQLTPLPEPLSSAGAAVISNTLYVAGGQGPDGAVRTLWSANLKEDILIWEKLPNIPMPLSHAVVVSQSDGRDTCLFVIGGRYKNGSTSTICSAIWKYKPSARKWEPAGEITTPKGDPMPLSAGTGVAIGDHYILIFGGDIGETFNKTEELLNAIAKTTNETEKQELIRIKNEGLEKHSGFIPDVLIYNTLTCKVKPFSELPSATPVTTTAALLGDMLFIPSGEIRPGVRTPGMIKAFIRIK